jgi:hypothetical protein
MLGNTGDDRPFEPIRAMKPVVLLSALLVTMSSSAAQYIYRWVDDESRVHYTESAPRDRPYETLRADTAIVTDQGAASTPGTATTKPKAPPSPMDANREFLKKAEEANKAEAEAKSKAATEKAARETRCKQAKTELAVLNSTIPRRLASVDENGNVARVTDEQYDQKKTEAQKAVNESCN